MASVSISCPSCSATDGVVRNGKSTAVDHPSPISHPRKTCKPTSTHTPYPPRP
ncbi:IS1 family transposase, partial [Shigella sonnei]|uniref:IS1 family transposase n=1 Tax=Shigella sonnei TaxID=624 RepID=UPI00311AB564